MVELVNDAALGVVYSKEWLVWEDDSQVGITLDHLKPLKKVGSMDFIDACTPKYTFSHPNRFATQFAQIALVIEKASFEDMRTKGFVQKGCAFTGHSLSEYLVFASIADVLIFLPSSIPSSIVALLCSVQSNAMRTTGPTTPCAPPTLVVFRRPSAIRQCVRLWTQSQLAQVLFWRSSTTALR